MCPSNRPRLLPTPASRVLAAAAVLAVALLSGCGQKGPLVLPKDTDTPQAWPQKPPAAVRKRGQKD